MISSEICCLGYGSDGKADIRYLKIYFLKQFKDIFSCKSVVDEIIVAVISWPHFVSIFNVDEKKMIMKKFNNILIQTIAFLFFKEKKKDYNFTLVYELHIIFFSSKHKFYNNN
jgi:hypothetical protein